MGIEFFTGFEGCNNDGDLYALFDSYDYVDWEPTAGLNSGKGMRGSTSTIGPAYRNHAIKNVSPAKTKATGLHVSRISTNSAVDYEMLKFIGPNVRINNTTSGIQIYVNEVLLDTFHEDITCDYYVHLEFELFSDSTNGYFKMKRNGVLIGDLTNINTGGEDITGIKFGSCGGNGTNRDNIYIASEMQGELYSVLLTPSSDESVEFTPSSGVTNYDKLATNDGDTTYVESDIKGHKDLYGYDDLDSGLIPKAISVVTLARKVGTGPLEFQTLSKYDSVEYEDSESQSAVVEYPNSRYNQAINKVYSLAQDGTELTREKVNGMQFGFKITNEIAS